MSECPTASHQHLYGKSPAQWHHTFRQSWLKEAALCPERGRATHAYDDERRETDAAAIGTALHLAASEGLPQGLSLTQCQRVALAEFDRIAALDNFVWAKYKPVKAKELILQHVGRWYREVRPTLDPGALFEYTFNVNLIDTPERKVDLSGTIDYFDGVVRDYKTSGRGEYTPWEYKRNDVQSHVYPYAVIKDGLTTDDYVEFEWIVFHGKGVQRFSVERSWDAFDWLKQKCEALALLIEADVPVWPKQDNHALCSPKWCEHWERCRGLSLGSDPWGR